jgi:hypothetical protein
VRLLVALVGIVGGSLIAYVGLFLILYSGDTGGDHDIYVRVGSSRIDADVVGIPLAAVGLIIVAASIKEGRFFRGRER